MEQTTPLHKKRTQRDYTLGFKLSVVDRIEKGEMTYKQAQKIYGIQGRSTVLVWLRKHGKLEWNLTKEHLMPKSPHTIETPAQTIKRQQRELEDERIRVAVMEEMLVVIGKKCGEDLRKKYLSKLSEANKLRGN